MFEAATVHQLGESEGEGSNSCCRMTLLVECGARPADLDPLVEMFWALGLSGIGACWEGPPQKYTVD